MTKTICTRFPIFIRCHRRTPAALALAGAALLLVACGDDSKDQASNAGAPAASPAPRAAESAPPLAVPAPVTLAMPTPATPADEAWEVYQKEFSSPPEPPASWSTNPPTEEAVATFQRDRGAAAEKIAELAKDFYTRFPSDARATPARWQELQLLDAAVKLGHTNVLARLETLEKERLADPSLNADERFGLRVMAAQRDAERLFPESEEKARASLAASTRKLIEEFPQRAEPYQMLLSMASDAPVEEARATARSMLSTNAPEKVRESAKELLARLDLVGKPLDLKFTAIDGREVDLAKMRGKVVLVDFWATWCGPCVAELPNVKTAYERLKPRGFEILGLSFDQDREALQTFLEREKMTWPQYFDGKGWENALGQRFGITAIPAMWLVDKQGVLRDLNARRDLEVKIARMLDEPRIYELAREAGIIRLVRCAGQSTLPADNGAC